MERLCWWIFLPNVLYYFAVPLTAFCFSCRYCALPFRWGRGAVYAAAYAFLIVAEGRMQVTGAAGLFAEVLLLAFFCGGLRRDSWARAVPAAALITSAFSVCGGTAQLIFYWMFGVVVAVYDAPARYFDLLQILTGLLLAVCFLTVIWKYFRECLRQSDWPAVFLLAIPVFYISLVERSIRDMIYGSTVIVDTELGLLYPEVRHLEILFLQLFACVCLFMILAAYQKTIQAALARQTIALLRQQAQVQEIYIQEAQSRYKRTQSFRHDVKNHLTVLAELLRTGQAEKSYDYLLRLEEIAAGLSYPVHTGCAAADALLGSKLAAAEQKGIAVECAVKIPEEGGIADIDWCIVLSNAVDNAIQASVQTEGRFIRITGKKKGNFYLLSVENSCKEEAASAPEEGIGLANIRAAAEKYGGTVHIESGGGVFKLDVLFVLSQHAECASQQRS